jgi:hypothetical protein
MVFEYSVLVDGQVHVGRRAPLRLRLRLFPKWYSAFWREVSTAWEFLSTCL